MTAECNKDKRKSGKTKKKIGKKKNTTGTTTMMIVTSPKKQDVLFGKSTMAFQWGGNVRLRELVAQLHNNYKDATCRPDKSVIVRSVYEDITSTGGRFIKLEPCTKRWYQVPRKMAIEKIGHVFRDANKVKYMGVLKDRLQQLPDNKNDDETKEEERDGAEETFATDTESTIVGSLPSQQIPPRDSSNKSATASCTTMPATAMLSVQRRKKSARVDPLVQSSTKIQQMVNVILNKNGNHRHDDGDCCALHFDPLPLFSPLSNSDLNFAFAHEQVLNVLKVDQDSYDDGPAY